MARTTKLRISFPALLGWVLPLGLLVGGVGIYPTLRIAGTSGLHAELAAGLVVLSVMLANGAWTVWTARKGPREVAFAFMLSGVVRVFVCLLVGVVVWQLVPLPLRCYAVWLGIFYLTMLLGEGVWMARALKRDALLVALGKIERSK